MKTNELLRCLTCVGLFLAAVPLAAEEPAVVTGSRVNVRGQPSLVGEVITQLQEGEKIIVLEEITLTRTRTNEPAKWARIQMPANTPVWVYAPFIDADGKSVKVSRLNLRAGPGENYSVVGRLERGTAVREIRRVEDWMEIETPAGAYGFVAANLLSRSGSTVAGARSVMDTVRTAPLPGRSVPASATDGAPQPGTQTTPSQSARTTPLPGTQTAQTTSLPGQSLRPAPSTAHLFQPLPPGERPTEPLRSHGVGETVMMPMVQSPGRSVTPSPAAVQPSIEQTTVPIQPSSRPSLPGAMAAAPPSSAPISAEPAAPSNIAPETRTATLPGTSSETRAPGVTAPSVSQPAIPPTLDRRVVRREGIVRSTVSIQAPTYYELLSPANRKTINYLHTENLGLNMKDYRGRRIIVTGEEAIDPRWPKTPVIEVETLELIP